MLTRILLRSHYYNHNIFAGTINTKQSNLMTQAHSYDTYLILDTSDHCNAMPYWCIYGLSSL